MIALPEDIEVLVRLNDAGVAPSTNAVTVYGPPTVALASTEAVVIPALFVSVVVVTMLAPVVGPENITAAPATGLPPASFTMTDKGAAKAVPTTALCPLPPVAVTVAAGPDRLVSEYTAAAVTPATLPLTA